MAWVPLGLTYDALAYIPEAHSLLVENTDHNEKLPIFLV